MNRAIMAQHVENTSALVELSNAFKNHKELIKANEEAVAALALTDEQIAKVNELKTLQQSNLEILTDIEKQKSALKKLSDINASDAEKNKKEKEAISEMRLNLIKESESNKLAAQRNEIQQKKNEDERAALVALKSELHQLETVLEEKEKALNTRAEKILLREKASEL